MLSLLSCKKVINVAKDFYKNCSAYILYQKIIIQIFIFFIIAEEKKHPEQECSICLDDMYNTETVTLDCNHRYHKKCINDWLKEKHDCPQCRTHALPADDYPNLRSSR